MASQITAATRMELLRLKKKVKLAQKGHKLLKEKRDALVSEFFKIIDDLKIIRKEIEDKMALAFNSLILAQAISGAPDVELAAKSTKELKGIGHQVNNIMGVRAPSFTYDGSNIEMGYSLISTSLELDTAAKNFEDVLKVVIRLAGTEATVRRLAEEIKKTKRKVNALERILIPRLKLDIVYIQMRLEEMERENFSRLKVIKKRISE
ncbi:MAG: V-type ATP synthase subunit D [Nanoarchaeota archaeon]